MKNILWLLLLIPLVFLIPTKAHTVGTSYNVCASGCNFATVAEVNAAHFTLDDHVCFKAETFHDRLDPQDSGFPGNEIYFEACAGNATPPIIDRIITWKRHDLIFSGIKQLGTTVGDRKFFEIQSSYNIKIINPTWDCLNTQDNKGLIAYRADGGTGAASHDIEVYGGTIQNCGVAGASQNGGGLWFAQGTYNAWTHDMVLLDNFEYAWQAADNTGTTDPLTNVRITDSIAINTLAGNGARNGINVGDNCINCGAERVFSSGYAACFEQDGNNSGVTNSAYFYNVIGQNCEKLVLIAPDNQNSRILNATLIGANNANWTTQYGVLYMNSTGTPMLGHMMKNVIINMPTNANTYKVVAMGAGTITVDMDYNQYYRGSSPVNFEKNGVTYTSLAAWQAATGLDAHSSAGDPGIDQALYTPGPSSAVTDTGTDVSAYMTVDYSKLARKSGVATDKGAKEYQWPVTPPSTSIMTMKGFTLNLNGSVK